MWLFGMSGCSAWRSPVIDGGLRPMDQRRCSVANQWRWTISPKRFTPRDVVSHSRHWTKMIRWLEEFSMLFFEARELFTQLCLLLHRIFFNQGTLSLLRRGYLTALEDNGTREVFWDILGSHKGKAADREVTINSCPKCLLQQFLLSVLLKMSWRRFIWASRFQKLLSFF